MMAEEYGQPKLLRTPWKGTLSTFAEFNSFGLALAATAPVFFGIGSVKSRWSPMSWWRSGLETLAVGLAAAALAFLIGYGLNSLV